MDYTLEVRGVDYGLNNNTAPEYRFSKCAGCVPQNFAESYEGLPEGDEFHLPGDDTENIAISLAEQMNIANIGPRHRERLNYSLWYGGEPVLGGYGWSLQRDRSSTAWLVFDHRGVKHTVIEWAGDRWVVGETHQ
jgi:hypothetical protein